MTDAKAVDVAALIGAAVQDWPLALRDDPTAFGPGDTWLSVMDKANAAIRDNARSSISRALGKLVDQVAIACDLEHEENGGLADMDGVLARFAPGLEVDTAPIYEASDWNKRLEAIRQVFGLAVAGMPVPTVQGSALRAFVAGEPRLAHLLAAESETPAVATPAPQETATEADGWDDEPLQPATPKRQRAAKAAPGQDDGTTEKLADMMAQLGMTDMEFAELLGISRAYLSLMRKGSRPWIAMNDAQREAVLNAVNTRLEVAIAAGRLIRGE